MGLLGGLGHAIGGAVSSVIPGGSMLNLGGIAGAAGGLADNAIGGLTHAAGGMLNPMQFGNNSPTPLPGLPLGLPPL